MAPLRLVRVPGLEGRANDALFVPAARALLPPPAQPLPRQHALVYFGGDVQDYPEVMQSHRDNRRYLRWNLENTAQMLSCNFPDKHIVVVRPSRIEYKSFSCYDNFVPSSTAGVPEHTPTHGALLHLQRLLENVSERVKATSRTELMAVITAPHITEDAETHDTHTPTTLSLPEPSEDNGSCTSGKSSDDAEGPPHNVEQQSPAARTPEEERLWWVPGLALGESALTLVGFSKGCVVLNQIVYEMHYAKTLTPDDDHMSRFIANIESMYWVDGGHGGGKNTWITARSLLETLTRQGTNIYVHVSPYQVCDESRPWIGREEKAFTSMLRKLGAKVRRYMHAGAAGPHSLHTHFAALRDFKRVQDADARGEWHAADDDDA